MAGIRGKESYLVKINTGTEASPTWTALEGIQPGLTITLEYHTLLHEIIQHIRQQWR